MAEGPGKYDNECSIVRAMSQGQAVALIVLQGNRGSGFSVQASHPDYQKLLPALLRDMANQIEGTTHEDDH